MTNPSPNLIQWLAGGERGVSSNTIVQTITGIPCGQDWARLHNHPHDPADLRRCRLLLEQCPEIASQLILMAEVSPIWSKMVARWDELCAMMDSESPNWRSGRGCCLKTYKIMDDIQKQAYIELAKKEKDTHE